MAGVSDENGRKCFANKRYAVETRPSQCLDTAMTTTSARHALTDVGTLRQLPLGLIGEDRAAKSNLQAGTVKSADPTRAMIGGAVHLEAATSPPHRMALPDLSTVLDVRIPGKGTAGSITISKI